MVQGVADLGKQLQWVLESVPGTVVTHGIAAEKPRQQPRIPTLQENNVRTGFFEREHFQAVRKHLPE